MSNGASPGKGQESGLSGAEVLGCWLGSLVASEVGCWLGFCVGCCDVATVGA